MRIHYNNGKTEKIIDNVIAINVVGNGCNRSLCEKFVRSGYDLNVIRRI